jgi:hypothetical protein
MIPAESVHRTRTPCLPCRIVGRKQRRGIHLQIEKIADRILVFGAVQAMQDDETGAWDGQSSSCRFPIPASRERLRKS